jgi:hypothetical protein
MGEEMMGMKKLGISTAMALTLAACGGEGGDGTTEKAKTEKAPATLAAGLYELSSEIVQLDSTDRTTPATKLKKGDTQIVKACVAADGQPEPKLFAEEGDTCEINNSYIRNGRISAELTCTREGMSGQVMPAMMGKFSADGFEGDITTMTYFVAEGDYRLTRKVVAKRVGDCPATPPA